MNLSNLLKNHLPGLLLAVLLGLYLGGRFTKPSIDFFPIASGHQPEISKDLLLTIQHANEDMNLLLEGKQPIHAPKGMKLTDGGSVCYENAEYQLWDYRKLKSVNDTWFEKRGVSVYLKRRDAGQGFILDDASYTWLERMDQPKTPSP